MTLVQVGSHAADVELTRHELVGFGNQIAFQGSGNFKPRDLQF